LIAILKAAMVTEELNLSTNVMELALITGDLIKMI
jgi:hypothetical protein